MHDTKNALWPLKFTLTLGSLLSFTMGLSFGAVGELSIGAMWFLAVVCLCATTLFISYLIEE